jgi:hypothetical protein
MTFIDLADKKTVGEFGGVPLSAGKDDRAVTARPR